MIDKVTKSTKDIASPGKPRRVAARDSTFLRADVRRGDGVTFAGLRVRNLSAGGLMVETTATPVAPFEPEEPLTIVLRNLGDVAARVVWTAPGRIGIEFDRPISPAAVRKAPVKSPGAAMELMKPIPLQSRRPGLKIG